MAWGLGEVSSTTRGVGQVAGHLMGEAFGVIATPFSMMRKFGKSQMDNYSKELDQIANPEKYRKAAATHTLDSYGNKVPISGMDSGLSNRIAPDNSFLRQKYNILKHNGKSQGKGFLIGGAISGSMYGLSAYATDNQMDHAGDRMYHYGKHAAAAGIDLAADATLGIVGMGLATLGPAGLATAGALNLFNMFAGFAGMDAGSLAMNVMNYADEQYEKNKNGPKFNMTQNTSMALQRQIQNMHASGSNLGEAMHN